MKMTSQFLLILTSKCSIFPQNQVAIMFVVQMLNLNKLHLSKSQPTAKKELFSILRLTKQNIINKD